ncbi:TTL domain profile [Nakaseomyces glabratus]|nr:TTL domain profile [Nakaseomyces glabratus]KAH7600979.1 TTL domain profile [Nakaseomyces glabratus]KAH7613418.1 TTL domain profile [Nakaseomyces glabratus]
MKVLITNDDGPLNTQYSPYIRPFVQYILQNRPDWQITVCVPHVQKSWIGKAHIAGKHLSLQFLYSKRDSTDDSYWGPYIEPQLRDSIELFPEQKVNEDIPADAIEWILLDGTPASCVNIGLHHFEDKYDLVISGPNVGRNTSAAYITSSGTVGAAMEAVICDDTRAIALSWAFFDGRKDVPNELMERASARSVDVIDHLVGNWSTQADLYSVNVPLIDSIGPETEAYYAPIWENRWTTIYNGPKINRPVNNDIEDGNESKMISFEWMPDFKGHRPSKHCDPDVKYDMDIIEERRICVTPLRAAFHTVPDLVGKLDLGSSTTRSNDESVAVLTIPRNSYIYEPLQQSIARHLHIPILDSLDAAPSGKGKVFQYGDYEDFDLDRVMDSQNYLVNSYIYRKAIIRKHYLSHTIQRYVSKHPGSILKKAYMESYTIDLDYAEFLDDALDENWELRQELEKNDRWWIVKPSMSDKAQGIRVFKTIEDLQNVFDSFDEEDTDEEIDEETVDDNKIIISQLRHFIIQEYMADPLLLPSMGNRKFHIRCYITCKGDLEVYVYDRMLALFAPKPFSALDSEEYSPTDLDKLGCHLTNTCLQSDADKDLAVMEFGNLTDISREDKSKIIEQIHMIAKDIFLAALNVDRMNFQPLRNAFETFGFDFLVDSSFNVKILEINAYPDFKQTGNDLKGLIYELFDDVVKTCVAPFFQEAEEPQNISNFTKVLDTTSNVWE